MTDELEPWTDTAVVAGLNLVPVVGGALGTVAARVLAGRRQGAATAGEAAIATAGNAHALLELVQSDDRAAALLTDACAAAARTTLDDKRRMLGATIGRVVLEPARIDEAELVVAALQDLDAPHLTCLERMIRAEDEGELIEGHQPGGYIFRTYPEPVQGALEAHGTVTKTGMFGGVVTRTSDFGRYLIEDLREAVRDLDLDAPGGDR